MTISHNSEIPASAPVFVVLTSTLTPSTLPAMIKPGPRLRMIPSQSLGGSFKSCTPSPTYKLDGGRTSSETCDIGRLFPLERSIGQREVYPLRQRFQGNTLKNVPGTHQPSLFARSESTVSFAIPTRTGWGSFPSDFVVDRSLPRMGTAAKPRFHCISKDFLFVSRRLRQSADWPVRIVRDVPALVTS